MGRALVIVESPAKARTISKYLGAGFEVESSIGHVRDLPSTAAEIPAKHKKEPWARIGVDVDRGFKPLYVVPPTKKTQVAKLKKALAKADELYLATDEDREGEAIAWHLYEVLRPKVPVKRMVFGEITQSAIAQAVTNTRAIDQRLVSAQEARRVLDRLYGYEVSPVLWKKVRPKLSAGRVQSVATRLVVERERARMAFRSARYWDLAARLEPTTGGRVFDARMVELAGRRIASGRDFDDATGQLRPGAEVVVLDEAAAGELEAALGASVFEVSQVTDKPYTRRPYPPFITSTLQQEAGRKLRFTAQRTMRVAQGLYENGYITYMRTDSVQLSAQAIEAARSMIEDLYGSEYLPAKTRTFSSKSKTAQEAHEAIRPAGQRFRKPVDVSAELDADALRLYELIWKRTMACQMRDAEGTTTSVKIEAATADGRIAGFAASGKVIRFPGFLRAYVEGSDDPEAELEDQEKVLPALAEKDRLTSVELTPSDHQTQPPARFTEATLVRELEEREIGRPSTYASILQTIQDRGYVWNRGSALIPTFTAFAVTQLLENHLSAIVDFDFTARMEGDLDQIANGEREAEPWLARFYFGSDGDSGDPGLKELIGSGWEAIDARQVCTIALGEDEGGREVVVRVGRYGPYLQVAGSESRVTIRDDIPPDELTIPAALELFEQGQGEDRVLGNEPSTGAPVYAKTGRFGDYVQLGDPVTDAAGKTKRGGKPKMASLWPSMSRDTLDLEQALKLLSYPREIGVDPETGETITAQDGRFGPYLKRGTDSRSLASHEELETITLEQALEVFKQPKKGRRTSSAALREIGAHPESGSPISLREGRFGPYVTDGTVNASLPKGRDPATLGLEQALELLAQRAQKIKDQGGKPVRGRRASR